MWKFCEAFYCCGFVPFASKRRDSDYKIKEDSNIDKQNEDENQNVDPIQKVFRRFAGTDNEVDAYQLRDMLNGHFKQQDIELFSGFSTDICRSMVAMKDEDLSGRLGYAEFKELWDDLHTWKNTFQKLDTENKGYFESAEFEQILRDYNVRANEVTLRAITVRYSDRNGLVQFEDFLSCAVKLKLMTESFRERDPGNSGRAKFVQDEFIQLAIYS